MKATIRRKLSMAARALKFESANPSSDESHAGVVTRLSELLAHADDVIRSEGNGDTGERAARRRRKLIRRNVQGRLRHLARVADVASKATPALAGKYVPAQYNTPNQMFIATARRMLADATADQAQLMPAGLGTTSLAELGTAIAEFDAAGGAADDARGEHVGARAKLEALVAETLELLRVLDGLNAVRLVSAPDLLAEWKSARNVFGPVNRTPEQVEDPTVEGGPTAPEASPEPEAPRAAA